MKKLVSIILALVIVSAMTTTTFAAEQYWDSNTGYGDTDVSLHVYSTYIVTIPSIVGTTMGTQGVVEISNALFEDNARLDIYPSNVDEKGYLILNHTTKEGKSAKVQFQDFNSEIATVSSPLATFYASDFDTSRDCTKYFYMNVYDYDAAGDFEGTLTYSFICNHI